MMALSEVGPISVAMDAGKAWPGKACRCRC